MILSYPTEILLSLLILIGPALSATRNYEESLPLESFTVVPSTSTEIFCFEASAVSFSIFIAVPAVKSYLSESLLSIS